MGKQTAKTLQTRLGFLDEDLKKPEHDEILKWLDKNVHPIVSDLFIRPDWTPGEIKNIKDQTEQIVGNEDQIRRFKGIVSDLSYKLKYDCKEDQRGEIQKRLEEAEKIIKEIENWKGIKGEIPKKKQITVIKKTWEYPISSSVYNDRTGYKSPKNLIGYVDMKVSFIYNRLCVNGIDFETKSVSNSNLNWDQTDLRYDDGQSEDQLIHSVYFEAKTKIVSLGELFRQLNTYKEFEQGPYIIVCPDDSEKEIIKEQGFYFYKYQ